MKLLSLLLLFCATVIITGCQTNTAIENTSERPWNAQKGWEHGLPTTINEGR